MAKKRYVLTEKEAKLFGFEPKNTVHKKNSLQFSIDENQQRKLLDLRGYDKNTIEYCVANRVNPKSLDDDNMYTLDKIATSNETKSETKSNEYKKENFVLSAWNKQTKQMMDINTYCEYYNLPRQDITSYKLVSHTGTPFYNIVFKENITEQIIDFDFESIIKENVKPIDVRFVNIQRDNDFDVLTFTDVHIGMETDKFNNSMYPVKWDRETVLKCADIMTDNLLRRKSAPVLYIDDLGDLLDGFNGKTTRGGHDLPQNMTNKEAYNCAMTFKMRLIDILAPHYEKIYFNNICNDNHAGDFAYFLNQRFKDVAEIKYNHVKVTNHVYFINHYYVGKICFLITHGKDDSTLKYGFKPKLDSIGLEKIDQYCKQNDIYKNSDLVVFKKGDSHQALFDMCTSDDFYYFNYPALSPSSQWVQSNFKKGRKGFCIEHYKDLDLSFKPIFI